MIRAEHIVKSFDGRVVLDDISVEFETGKTNLIIGCFLLSSATDGTI